MLTVQEFLRLKFGNREAISPQFDCPVDCGTSWNQSKYCELLCRCHQEKNRPSLKMLRDFPLS